MPGAPRGYRFACGASGWTRRPRGFHGSAHPQSGTLVVGNFRRGSEAESSASPRATFVSGGAPPAEVWSVPLASSGATLGAGLDLVGNALVITDGTARWGAGATSAQWISSSGIDLTGDFLLFSSEPSEWGWLEASPLVGGGLAIRRVKVTDMFRRELASRYLCVLAVGSTACEPAPEWLSLRANVRIEPVRNGTAYAALPDPMFVPDCKQTVELVDAT